jgi:hypothetical protein
MKREAKANTTHNATSHITTKNAEGTAICGKKGTCRRLRALGAFGTNLARSLNFAGRSPAANVKVWRIFQRSITPRAFYLTY